MTNLPNQNSWDHFWSKDHARHGTTKSWSKRRIEHLLRSCDPPRHKVLDAGCGSGYFSKQFCDWGWDAVALDYSQEALNIAKNVTADKVQTMQADLVRDDLAQRFPQKDVSLIFSDGLLEHFQRDDQDRILRNFHSVLEDDGQVLTVVPNQWSPWQIIRPFFMPGIVERPFVLSRLVELHESNGFQIVRAGGLNVLPFRISPEFLGPQLGMLLYVVGKKR